MGRDLKDDQLSHFGVKGQKWGVTRSKNQIRSADAARAGKLQSRAKKHGLNSLSNDEIATLNKRNQITKQHRDLNPSTIKQGYKAATTVLAVAGTVTALYNLRNNVLVQKGVTAVTGMVAKNKLNIII